MRSQPLSHFRSNCRACARLIGSDRASPACASHAAQSVYQQGLCSRSRPLLRAAVRRCRPPAAQHCSKVDRSIRALSSLLQSTTVSHAADRLSTAASANNSTLWGSPSRRGWVGLGWYSWLQCAQSGPQGRTVGHCGIDSSRTAFSTSRFGSGGGCDAKARWWSARSDAKLMPAVCLQART